jgi:ketosteroid isomerase-like protein
VWFAAWERADFEYEEFIDAGDSVVTILSQRVRRRTSGVELEWNSYAQVWTVQNDKIVRVEASALLDRSPAAGAGGAIERTATPHSHL